MAGRKKRVRSPWVDKEQPGSRLDWKIVLLKQRKNVFVYAYFVIEDDVGVMQIRDRPRGTLGLFGGQVEVPAELPDSAFNILPCGFPKIMVDTLVRELSEEVDIDARLELYSDAIVPNITLCQSSGDYVQYSVCMFLKLPRIRLADVMYGVVYSKNDQGKRESVGVRWTKSPIESTHVLFQSIKPNKSHKRMLEWSVNQHRRQEKK